MRDLLAEDGSIYVHCDWRVNSYIRLVMDEVFGKDNFRVDIQWQRVASRSGTKSIPIIHDTILLYSKKDKWIYNPVYEAYNESYLKSHYNQTDEQGRKFRWDNATASGEGPSRIFFGKEIAPPSGTHWRWTQENIDRLISEGKIGLTSKGKPQYKRYLDEMPGRVVQSVWTDIPPVNSQAVESLGYPTQKPVPLIERIVNTSSNEGDLVTDFFCGSGTTAAVAEKLGRKWIASDLGKFAIHTTRKRMIGVQRQLKQDKNDWRAFEILNLGKYERQHYIGVNTSLREEEKLKQLEAKEKHFVDLILHAYRAESVENFKTFHAKKAGRMVAVGPVNLPVTRLYVEEVILECREKRISRADILGFEFEMGLFPNILDEAKTKGIDLAMKYIPRDVFDKRAVEKNQVVFHDVSYIEVRPHVKKKSIAVELTDFSVFYSQDIVDNVAESLKVGKNKIVVEKGQIVKISKDKKGIITREVLTQNWTDWIDYWSVDFDFESKRELIAIKNEETGEAEEYWTGDFIFENEWQSFRIKKDRELELKTPFHECKSGRYKVAVKVVDIFGNDTMKIIEVSV
ncbi:site-specific DNA-methyltransferase, partial [candidate division WOR-3 bacterium]|nr:site-specific DNA-methyltransferase [candidate division WOR-3 bacterium]